MSKSREGLSIGVAIGLPLAVGMLGAIATASSVSSWYRRLRKPSFNPPDQIFGPVWTILYILMGAASWLVWRRGREAGTGRQSQRALQLYGVQLGLNLLWSVVFFGLRRIEAGVGVIALLWGAILATLARFYRLDPVAGWLLVPYQLWTTFAGVLNVSIWRLNRQG